MLFLDYNGLSYYTSKVKTLLNSFVPTSRTVNGKALSSNITLSAADVSALPSSTDLSVYAPKDSPVFTGSISLGRKANTTVGRASIAEGENTTASGGGSHAEGGSAIASGEYSHAEGVGTTASGANAHAEGSNTTAGKAGSHAEGASTTASGLYSHAEGQTTTASQTCAHAEGYKTKAEKKYSHSEGNAAIASGEAAHAEGDHTVASGEASHSEGCGTFCDSAFGGHAEGHGTIAISTQCFLPIASYSNNVFTITYNATNPIVSNSDVDRIFDALTVNAEIYIWSRIDGPSYKQLPTIFTIASWNKTNHTITTNIAPASNFSIGSPGYAVIPSARYINTISSAQRSPHAEGFGSIAIAQATHAEGNNTAATNQASHAEGFHTKATGTAAHAEGNTTIASGDNSHAEGYNTIASGNYSHAEGYLSTASNYASHSSGKYNKAMTTGGALTNTTGDVFVIGNGTSASALSNALRLDFSGQLYLTKTYSSTGADYAEYFEWLDENPNDEDRVGRFVTLEGNKIKFAQKGDYILGAISGLPCVIGNGDEDWLGRWEHDEFNRFVKEYLVYHEVEVELPPEYAELEDLEYNPEIHSWMIKNEIKERDGKYFKMEEEIVDYTTKDWRHKANPNYDPNEPYIERQDRKEWDAVGMVGVLSVIDDGTCEVNHYCEVAQDGIATSTESYIPRQTFRVIDRVAENIIKIIFVQPPYKKKR